MLSPSINNASKVALNYFRVHIIAKTWLQSIVRKTYSFYCAFWSTGQWGPLARDATATGSNTATRVPHGNKLLSKNSLYLIIFKNLYILYCKVQILVF